MGMNQKTLLLSQHCCQAEMALALLCAKIRVSATTSKTQWSVFKKMSALKFYSDVRQRILELGGESNTSTEVVKKLALLLE